MSTRKRDVKDGNAADAAREPEVVRAFRDTWQLGIHSYLSYLRDRFSVARELLTETGSIFVQIGDENVHLVRCVLDEVFGSENFVSNLHFKKTGSSGAGLLDNVADTILWFARSVETVKYRSLFRSREPGNTLFDAYRSIDENGRRYQAAPITSSRPAQEGDVKNFQFNGKAYTPGSGTFKTDLNGLKRLASGHRLIETSGSLRYKRYLDDFEVAPYSNLWADTMGAPASEKVYVVQTASVISERCILMVTDPGDLVLDPTCGSGTTAYVAEPTCGSGTTAYVAEQWGRRWITVDTSRVALALARTRLMAGRFPYYQLADSHEGLKKEAEVSGEWPVAGGWQGNDITATNHQSLTTNNDIKKGFVYKRVPHVTLKSIANNTDIHEGLSREEIDRAILRHADTEYLFDQPYEDNKRIRVTGPFTVESLSPHRILSADADNRPNSEVEAHRDDAANGFVTRVLENLRKAGVQNTKKGERLVFDDLQPYAGKWIHLRGTYRDSSDSRDIRVAVSVGPEGSAVGPQQVKEAAKEAVEGFGHDLLIVVGYAFDPHVNDESKKFGELTVLPVRINAELQMADDLMKKTGAGNLFTVFGEPDVLVVSDEWLVTGDGRRLARWNVYQELSGLGSLEAVNRLGRENPRAVFESAAPGEIRSRVTDETGSHLHTEQYSGGSGTAGDSRVPALPRDSERVVGGVGNSVDSRSEVQISNAGTIANDSAGNGCNRKDALGPDELAAIKTVTSSDFPLTTSHQTQVTIRGVDIFDPNTGEIKSSSVDDIACWFIDTNYNGESFFVRHAYFLGAGDPYDKLKRALRAEVDAAAWSTLYRNVSRPFPVPDTGKIAVKVINHYGDEVLKVYSVN